MAGAGSLDRRKYSRLGTDQIISFAEVDRKDQLAVGKNLSSGGISFRHAAQDLKDGCESGLPSYPSDGAFEP